MLEGGVVWQEEIEGEGERKEGRHVDLVDRNLPNSMYC